MRAVLVVVMLASLSGCSRARDGEMASTSSVALTTTVPPRQAEVSGVEIGLTYQYRLSTHCGIEWARIDGAWWRTAPLSDGHGNPPPGWDQFTQPGTLTILDMETAQFTGTNGQELTFRRAQGSENLPRGCA